MKEENRSEKKNEFEFITFLEGLENQIKAPDHISKISFEELLKIYEEKYKFLFQSQIQTQSQSQSQSQSKDPKNQKKNNENKRKYNPLCILNAKE